MIRKILLSAIWMLFVSTAIAQTANLKGTVYNNDNAPLPYVSIIIHSINRSCVSDSLGNFVLQSLNKGTYYLKITRLGFNDQLKRVVISSLNEVNLNINLSQKIVNIKTITIGDRKNYQNIMLGKLDLQLRPVSSSQDLLRLVPGLLIAQHAGGGKAEQIFMRGFDVDHGTDFAIYVDGIPVNMTSHAHGQGYADLHFLIPETVNELEVNKGPHNTRYGDLATAGSGEFRTISFLDRNRVKLENGMFGTKRALILLDLLGEKRHFFSKRKEDIISALEYRYTNSYFVQKQHFNRFNFFTKYTGELNNGDMLMISLSSFESKWDASGQIPNRKVEDGSLSPFGSIDPTEGGNTGRSNLNLVHERKYKTTSIKNQIYYSRYDFKLYSNFTFYLNDSIYGDQIEQGDHRNILGYNSTLQIAKKPWGKELVSILGAGIRYDNASIELNHTAKRQFLNTMVAGKLNQVNGFVYVDESFDMTKKLKINLGARADVYNFNFDNYTYDTASGNAMKAIVSPKLNLYYIANDHIRFFAKSGFGFHSNDARAVVVGSLENTLARAFGNEVGSFFKPSNNLIVNVALWTLDLESELVYVGDEGIVEVSGRTRRLGIDIGLRYQLADYLYLDADLNMNKGKLRDEPSEANSIPLAPTVTSIGGITFKKPDGLSGSLRYRYMGDRPAIEDYSIVAKGYLLMDVVANYNFKNYQFGVSVENLLNKKWKEAQFATGSRLQTENAPVNEIHFTPGSPFFAKVSFGYLF